MVKYKDKYKDKYTRDEIEEYSLMYITEKTKMDNYHNEINSHRTYVRYLSLLVTIVFIAFNIDIKEDISSALSSIPPQKLANIIGMIAVVLFLQCLQKLILNFFYNTNRKDYVFYLKNRRFDCILLLARVILSIQFIILLLISLVMFFWGLKWISLLFGTSVYLVMYELLNARMDGNHIFNDLETQFELFRNIVRVEYYINSNKLLIDGLKKEYGDMSKKYTYYFLIYPADTKGFNAEKTIKSIKQCASFEKKCRDMTKKERANFEQKLSQTIKDMKYLHFISSEQKEILENINLNEHIHIPYLMYSSKMGNTKKFNGLMLISGWSNTSS